MNKKTIEQSFKEIQKIRKAVFDHCKEMSVVDNITQVLTVNYITCNMDADKYSEWLRTNST